MQTESSTLKEKRSRALVWLSSGQRAYLDPYKKPIEQRIDQLQAEKFSERLWRKEPDLWKSDSQHQEIIANALGWLQVAEKMEGNLPELIEFAAEVQDAGFRRVVHIGMGGSSLAPMVFARSFPPGGAGLPLTVLDTTDPGAILNVERERPLEDTLFIIASKSGTTAETRALADYFYHWVSKHKNSPVGENFVAITDPGTPLAELAREQNYRRTFLNFPDIGGRYSALSYFGLVPAALMGLDVEELLARSQRMLHACAASVPASENPALSLGAAIAELALRGRDKLTFLVPDSMATFGLWLEQLIAENLGKEGKGIVPIAGEPIGVPLVYADDRVFVNFRIKHQDDQARDELVGELENAGHPVITILMDDPLDLGQEFFRWELATAVAGAILGVDAFNQPNVQESKDNTNRLLAQLKQDGHLPEVDPDLIQGGISLFAGQVGDDLPVSLHLFLAQARPGDYVALMAYLTENPQTTQALQEIRTTLRNSLHLATTLGYGPRFLHSTGQLHKGGPNTGLFLQITADDDRRPRVRNEPYTFDDFKLAQALGDLHALRQHRRRIVRLHLGAGVPRGLRSLKRAVEKAFSIQGEIV